MTNIEKEEYFSKLAIDQDPKNAVLSPVGNQSHRITLPCGCSQVIHPLCGKVANPEAQSLREHFFEFCKTHN